MAFVAWICVGLWQAVKVSFGSFRKLGVPYLGILTIRNLLFRVLY